MKKIVSLNRQFTHVFSFMFFVIAAGLFCLVLTGCQRDGLNSVAGTVTFDGAPLEEGIISFMPSGDSGISTGGQIKNGAYSLRVSPGKMIVKIYAERPLTPEEAAAIKNNPMSQASMTPAGVEVKKQFLPEKYNDKSSLSADIQGNTKNLDFQLESQSKL